MTSVTSIKPAKLHPNTVLTNEQYQQILDTLYPKGTVTTVYKAENAKTATLHSCSNCGVKFYGVPYLMVNFGQRHLCEKSGERSSKNGQDGGRIVNQQRKRKESEKEKQARLNMVKAIMAVEAGHNVSEVVKEMKVSPSELRQWCERLGLIKSKRKTK